MATPYTYEQKVTAKTLHILTGSAERTRGLLGDMAARRKAETLSPAPEAPDDTPDLHSPSVAVTVPRWESVPSPASILAWSHDPEIEVDEGLIAEYRTRVANQLAQIIPDTLLPMHEWMLEAISKRDSETVKNLSISMGVFFDKWTGKRLSIHEVATPPPTAAELAAQQAALAAANPPSQVFTGPVYQVLGAPPATPAGTPDMAPAPPLPALPIASDAPDGDE